MFEMSDGRRRVAIENVVPEVNCGRFPIKRVQGETITVCADIFCDGHEMLHPQLLYKRENEKNWERTDMVLLGNDRWEGSFRLNETGFYQYTIEAWIDRFSSWKQGMVKKTGAETDDDIDFQIGKSLIQKSAQRAFGNEKKELEETVRKLERRNISRREKIRLVLDDSIEAIIRRYPDKQHTVRYGKKLAVWVDPKKAAFSTWYEIFPRSWSGKGGTHGTFKDIEKQLDYFSSLGIDILYFPPIHPIGTSYRKGKNNRLQAERDDPGSPWAIGAEDGGHTSIHSELGTLEDFRSLVQEAKRLGIDIALDIAFQCSPDHPYLRDHPEWFKKRPDGTIQYAENPPKKYEDIYPFDFECDEWKSLWEELQSIFLFWIEQDVRVFRVDNPHTKPFVFWEWLIWEIKREHPDIIFLSEAFTRPRIMYRLAKLGFTQSYTYFTWRNSVPEMREYLTELTKTEVKEYFRPNFWPNTPDILSEYLQNGKKPAFITRLVLAATLSPNYGIYAPAFELLENQPRENGSEEYLNAEKYEIKDWDLQRENIRNYITKINTLRRNNSALQQFTNVNFYNTGNDHLLAYSKYTDDGKNILLIVVNFDYMKKQNGWLDFSLEDFGIPVETSYTVHDLLNDESYTWKGLWNFVELSPPEKQAHIFRIEKILP